MVAPEMRAAIAMRDIREKIPRSASASRLRVKRSATLSDTGVMLAGLISRCGSSRSRTLGRAGGAGGGHGGKGGCSGEGGGMGESAGKSGGNSGGGGEGGALGGGADAGGGLSAFLFQTAPLLHRMVVGSLPSVTSTVAVRQAPPPFGK